MTWLLVVLGFSALIVLHEAGHFVAAKATGMRVERFFLFFPPKLASVKRGETEYGIGTIPLGGYVKITGMNPDEELPPEVAARGYYHQPVWKRIVVIGAGPAVNIALAFLIFFALALGAGNVTQKVGQVLPGTPAARVLKPGDEILAVDGRRYARLSSEERLTRFVDRIGSHKCPGRQVDGCLAAAPVKLLVRAPGGRAQTISVRPRYDAAYGSMKIGFRYGEEPANLSITGAAGRAAGFVWEVTRKTVSVFTNIFNSAQRKQISGIVGIGDVAHQAIGFGVRDALGMLALISLSLGLINLFPFLPLDGGHIFWSLVEKLRGEPVPFRVIEGASAIGFVLVIMLFFIGLSNDVGRLTGEGFHVR